MRYAHILINNHLMKKSAYNICVKKENGAFIYNSFNNVYVAMSKKLCEAFEKMDLDKIERTYPMAYSRFKEAGLLIPDDMDELAIIRYKNKLATFASRELRLVIYPTQD